MLLRGFSVMLFSGIFLCATAGAAIFERAWQTPGDGLLTYDDVNQREWLDLSETIMDQFPGNTLEEKYQSVVAETTPGGMFEDFSVAKGDDAEALALSAGIDITTGDFGINEFATRNIIDLLGVTLFVSDDRFESNGAIDELEFSSSSLRRVAARFIINGNEAGFSVDVIGERGASNNTAVMLYRHIIPEPYSLLLCVQTATLFMTKRRYRT